MDPKIVMAAATWLFGRSNRFRWMVPVLPLAYAAYQLYKQHQAANPPAQRLATA